MAETIDPYVRYLTQLRCISDKKAGKWVRSPSLFKTFYEAVIYRDGLVSMIQSKNHETSTETAFMELIRPMLNSVGAHFEVRIIKRRITDEVIEEVETVNHG